MNATTDFNTLANEANVEAPIKEEYRIGHGHIVLFAIEALMPVKDEKDAVDEEEAKKKDIRLIVPWYEGISARLVALKAMDEDGTVRELAKEDPNGKIELPFGHKNLTFYTRTNQNEITNGWARKYTPGGKRRLNYSLPDGFHEMTNVQRFNFWRTVLGGKFGFENGQCVEGATFYAYVTYNRTKQDKIWTDVRKVYKAKDGEWMDKCPSVIGSVPTDFIARTSAAISAGFDDAREDGESFNFGNNAKKDDASEAERLAGF